MNITIDGKKVCVEENQSILEAALKADIYVPHLCYHPDLPSFDEVTPIETCYRGEEVISHDAQGEKDQGCGLCFVKVQGEDDLVLSCTAKIEEGMDIVTNSSQIDTYRKKNLVRILANHPHACLTCAQREGCSLTQCSTNVPEEERCCPQFNICELRKVAEYIGIREDLARYVPRNLFVEEDKPLFTRDFNLCIGCLRCVRVCQEVVGAKALGYVISADETIVGSTRVLMEETGCRFCGACVEVCPTGALRDKNIKPGDRLKALVPCKANCPVEMDIPSYVDFIAEGNYSNAAALIKEKVPLAEVLGQICHHPCEAECRRGELNQPVAICALKRFALENSDVHDRGKREKESGKKIVILGSGPAGLVAAYYLAKSGHAVTVYEEQSKPGGMLRWAIPEYRLPQEIIDREIQGIEAMGVEILTDSKFTLTDFVKNLERKKWDALFLAPGTQKSKKIKVPGSELKGVYYGLEFLKEIKQGKQKEIKGKVVVIGGGNVAMDAAMAALRLGAEAVDIVCLERKEEMPAFDWEIQEAEDEGIIFHHGWGPNSIEGNGNGVKRAVFIGCTSVFDEKGNFNPTFDFSSEKSLEVATVIIAVGQTTELSFVPPDSDINLTEIETIKVNPNTLETNIPGIFAGGEAATGPSSAVEAMAAGRKAASSIDTYLGENGVLDPGSDKKEEDKGNLWVDHEEGFALRERVLMPVLTLSERLSSFDIIQQGYNEGEAREEAGRCLKCNMRFNLSPVTSPPEKWLDFTEDNINQIPEIEGVIQLLDEEKNVIYIGGTLDLKQTLQEQLSSNQSARYFVYEEDPMYTKRESELIQQFLQIHGHLPSGNEEIEDLF